MWNLLIFDKYDLRHFKKKVWKILQAQAFYLIQWIMMNSISS